MTTSTITREKTDLTERADELRSYQHQESEAVFQIGRILSEVKALDIPVGQWTKWLESVDYSPRTAQRYMQIYQRFHSILPAQGASISKLTEFLSLPVDVDESKIIGELKGKSVREIRERIREIKGNSTDPVQEAQQQDDQAVIVARLREELVQKEAHLTQKDGEIKRLRAGMRDLEQEKATLKRENDSLRSDNLALQTQARMFGADNGLKVFAHIVGLSETAKPSEIKRAFRKAQGNACPDGLKRDDSKRNWISQRYNTASDMFQRMYG